MGKAGKRETNGAVLKQAMIRRLPRRLQAKGELSAEEKLSEIGAIEAIKLDNDTFGRESRFLLLRLKMMDVRLSKRFVAHHVREARAHYGGCVSTPRLQQDSFGQTILD